MNAHEAWHLLSAYLDGELSPQDRTEVRTHLELCSDCREELESLRRTKRFLASAPRRDAPAALVAELQRRYARPSWARRFLEAFGQPRVWVPLGAAAALTLALWVDHRRNAAEELPLEPLMAAHSRYTAEGLVPHGDLVASNFSAQLAAYEGQE